MSAVSPEEVLLIKRYFFVEHQQNPISKMDFHFRCQNIIRVVSTHIRHNMSI